MTLNLDLERIAIEKKQKIENIHKEPGQSNRQLSSTRVNNTKEPDQSNCQFSSTRVNDTKEPDQSNCQLSSTTVTDTTIKESKNKINVAFKKIFSDIKTGQIHNYYLCQQ